MNPSTSQVCAPSHINITLHICSAVYNAFLPFAALFFFLFIKLPKKSWEKGHQKTCVIDPPFSLPRFLIKRNCSNNRAGKKYEGGTRVNHSLSEKRRLAWTFETLKANVFGGGRGRHDSERDTTKNRNNRTFHPSTKKTSTKKKKLKLFLIFFSPHIIKGALLAFCRSMRWSVARSPARTQRRNITRPPSHHVVPTWHPAQHRTSI